MKLFEKLEKTIVSLGTFPISTERKTLLNPLVRFLQTKRDQQEPIRLNFICTHNSRRSHLSQVWAQTIAAFFNIRNVECYSGGTEATALYPMVLQTLKNAGFESWQFSTGRNPAYCIKFSDNAHPIMGFSKVLHDSFNPKSDFAAIMTCSQADKGCPFVAGAEARFSLPYEDPKLFDDTTLQTDKYKEKSLEIAAELFYVFSQIK